LNDTEYVKYQAKNAITDLPQGFKDFIAENEDKQDGWASTPYFIRDNFVNGSLAEGVRFEVVDDINTEQQSELQLLDIEIEKLKALANEYGVGTGMLDNVRSTQNVEEIKKAVDFTKNLVNTVKNQYESFLGEVQSALKEAKDANVDASDLKALESQLVANKADYKKIKESINNAINTLRNNVAKTVAQQTSSTNNEREINNKEIEVKLKIKQGEEMSFEDANEQKGNPLYGTEKGYGVNCQSCVVANELRRRGFDVSAQKNTKRSGNIPRELSTKTNLAWIDTKTGKMPIKQIAGGLSKTLDQLTNELHDLTKDVGRYHIDWKYKGVNSGHIITLERLPNGIIRFYDPQDGKIKTWDELKKNISLKSGVRILRIDNLLVNIDIINGVVIPKR